MTHKERILKAARGEMPDVLPYIPRIDLWYSANSRAGTLPKEHRGRTAYEISRAEGWGLMTASIDYTYQFLPESLLHRAIGAYALKEHVFKFVFSPKIEIRVKEEGERTRIEYHTPKGTVRTCKVYSEEMKRGGVSIPWIEEHIIKKPEDFRIVAQTPDVLGLSALLTMTMPEMKKIIQSLSAGGLRSKVKIMVGGAPVNQRFAQEIGADGYGHDAAAAVDLARGFLIAR